MLFMFGVGGEVSVDGGFVDGLVMRHELLCFLYIIDDLVLF